MTITTGTVAAVVTDPLDFGLAATAGNLPALIRIETRLMKLILTPGTP
jgi:hypothetical protein